MKRLYKKDQDSAVGGVFSGLSEITKVDVTILRLVFLIAAIFFSNLITLYFIFWVSLPKKEVVEKYADDVYDKSLHKSKNNEANVFLGVCQGLSESTNVDVAVIRILLASVFAFLCPHAILVYLVCGIVFPSK